MTWTSFNDRLMSNSLVSKMNYYQMRKNHKSRNFDQDEHLMCHYVIFPKFLNCENIAKGKVHEGEKKDWPMHNLWANFVLRVLLSIPCSKLPWKWMCDAQCFHIKKGEKGGWLHMQEKIWKICGEDTLFYISL